MVLKPVILLELNEINFYYVERYIADGRLPNFSRLISKCGIQRTTSEREYEHLEPWIQWVTAHTGKSLSEHGVFRLGDIVNTSVEQIWEFLEKHGLKVGAISPMNAKNRTLHAEFFVPDPWTNTEVTGSKLVRKISEAVSQAVNDNAQSKIGANSLLWLTLALLRFVPLSNYRRYFSLFVSLLKGHSWSKAQFLDELLSDVAISLVKQKNPHFASLFLNAGAHIQHHYMFNSTVYEGKERNPEWLIDRNSDPVFDVYSQYDQIVGKFLRNFPKHRLMIATGLHQDPYPHTKYYWRLLNHSSFLNLIGVKFTAVEPRMSRDFLIKFEGIEEALDAERKLNQIVANDSLPVFEVDNRGSSLFVMLTYPNAITDKTTLKVGNQIIADFKNHVVFVAIKNGEHNGEGFLIDTDQKPSANAIPLKVLPARISSAFGLQWQNSSTKLEHENI